MGKFKQEVQKESDEFLNRLRSGDVRLKEELVELYTEHLYRAALGLGLDSEKAADLTQNVWLSFFEKLDRFEGRSKVRTYLFGILYHKAKEMRRELKKEAAQISMAEAEIESRFDAKGSWAKPPMDPERSLEGAQLRGEIQQCSSSLTEEQRLIFTLREVEGMNSLGVQESTGLSANHIGVILYRARNLLRECLEAIWKHATRKLEKKV